MSPTFQFLPVIRTLKAMEIIKGFRFKKICMQIEISNTKLLPTSMKIIWNKKKNLYFSFSHSFYGVYHLKLQSGLGSPQNCSIKLNFYIYLNYQTTTLGNGSIVLSKNF